MSNWKKFIDILRVIGLLVTAVLCLLFFFLLIGHGLFLIDHGIGVGPPLKYFFYAFLNLVGWPLVYRAYCFILDTVEELFGSIWFDDWDANKKE